MVISEGFEMKGLQVGTDCRSCTLCGSRTAVFWEQRSKFDPKLYDPSALADLDQSIRFHRCPVCDLVFKDPRLHLSQELEVAHYRNHRNDPADPAYRGHLLRLADPLLTKITSGARGLDFGAGPTPTMASIFEERGFECRSWDPNFDFGFRPDRRSFDFITCNEVVEHFKEPGREFKTLFELLKPNGWLAVRTATRPEPEQFAAWYYHLDPTHVSFFTRRTFRWIAAEYGADLFAPNSEVTLLRRAEH